MQRAIEMLKEDRWTITQIAEAVGFNSVHYFSRCFRDSYGMAPSLRASMLEPAVSPQDDTEGATRS